MVTRIALVTGGNRGIGFEVSEQWRYYASELALCISFYEGEKALREKQRADLLVLHLVLPEKIRTVEV